MKGLNYYDYTQIEKNVNFKDYLKKVIVLGKEDSRFFVVHSLAELLKEEGKVSRTEISLKEFEKLSEELYGTIIYFYKGKPTSILLGENILPVKRSNRQGGIIYSVNIDINGGNTYRSINKIAELLTSEFYQKSLVIWIKILPRLYGFIVNKVKELRIEENYINVSREDIKDLGLLYLSQLYFKFAFITDNNVFKEDIYLSKINREIYNCKKEGNYKLSFNSAEEIELPCPLKNTDGEYYQKILLAVIGYYYYLKGKELLTEEEIDFGKKYGIKINNLEEYKVKPFSILSTYILNYIRKKLNDERVKQQKYGISFEYGDMQELSEDGKGFVKKTERINY